MDGAWVSARSSSVALRDGGKVLVRPVLPEDKDDLRRGFDALSEQSRYRRFMGALSRLTDAHLRYLTEIDYDDHFALVAIALDEPDAPGIGVARYVRDPGDRTAAEAAVAVIDRYHGQGLGTILLEMLGAIAIEHGVTRFTGTFLSENAPIHDLLEHMGARFERGDPGETRFEVDLPAEMERLKDSAMYGFLRAVARGEGRVRWPG